jgi:hypothetical protein
MARGTKEQEQAPEVSQDFPYRALMAHPAWEVVDQALGELEDNDDLELRTARRYVVGFIVQQLVNAGQAHPPLPEGFKGRLRYQLVAEVETTEFGARIGKPKKRPALHAK